MDGPTWLITLILIPVDLWTVVHAHASSIEWLTWFLQIHRYQNVQSTARWPCHPIPLVQTDAMVTTLCEARRRGWIMKTKYYFCIPLPPCVNELFCARLLLCDLISQRKRENSLCNTGGAYVCSSFFFSVSESAKDSAVPLIMARWGIAFGYAVTGAVTHNLDSQTVTSSTASSCQPSSFI